MREKMMVQSKDAEQNNNIVLFPKLKRRLLERGHECLNEKQFQEAHDTFQLMREYEYHTAETELAMIICLVELGRLQEAKETCEELVWGKMQHFDALEIYLSILVQLNNYEEVERVLERAFKEDGISQEHVHKLRALLSITQKMNDTIVDEEDSEELHYIEDVLLHNNDVKAQMSLLQSLHGRMLKYALPTFREFLASETRHPMVKTMILHVLMKEQIEATLFIKKFNRTMEVSPFILYEEGDDPFVGRVMEVIDEKIGQHNPMLAETAKEYFLQHLYILFPFLPEPQQENLWAAALHTVGVRLYGFEEEDEIASMYGVEAVQLHNIVQFLVEIEEVSTLI
jgi:tetratricopeptide (TPR) repeat protein